jgi:2-polyprenyl-3-methyl-5-hydroxy-6-metoxy-1,4-benzoquinol methylase
MEQELCPLCKNKEIRILKGFEKNLLNKCLSCNFIFSSRIPEAKVLEDHYNNYGNYNGLSDITFNRFDELLTTFSAYRKCNNILDFGCGEGFFLERAKMKGWNTYGIEYGKEAIKICQTKGINMIDSNQPSLFEKFDVAYISEVIEHISYPLEILRQIHLYLRPGGILYITTPNFNSISRYYVGNKWNIISYPEHLSYFTTKTLKKSLKLTNYKIEKIKTHGISMTRIQNSRNTGKNTNRNTANTDEKLRQLTEATLLFYLVKRFLNFLFQITYKGDTIKCYAIKK